MAKRYLILACFLAVLCSAGAQTISRWECWFDSDYTNRMEATTADTIISLSIPVADLSHGIHFFNFRAVNTDGEVGNLMRTMFYRSENHPNDTTLTGYEIWIDDDYSNRTVSELSDTVVALTADVSGLAPGIHFFNFRSTNSIGETSNVMRTMFYMPEEPTPDVAGYEYWIDNPENKVEGIGNGAVYSFILDVSSLAAGEHTFCFRARNSFGDWGPTYEEVFELSLLTDIDKVLGNDDKPFDVYNLAGMKVLDGATKDDLRRLPSSIYVIDGRKVIVK